MGTDRATRRCGWRQRVAAGVVVAATCVVTTAVSATALPTAASGGSEGAVGVGQDGPVLLFDVASGATDVNDRGVIVGWYEPQGDGVVHAFRRSPGGRVTDLGPGYAAAVNDAGVVAGTVQGDTGSQAVAWGADGHRRDLGVQTTSSEALDVNADGTIVGYGGGEGPTRAFVAEAGEPVEFLADPCTSPDGYGTLAAGLNDRGTIVGRCVEGDNTLRVVVWGARTHDPSVVPAGRDSYDIQDINERGTIVGSTITDGGYQAVTFVGPRHREVDVPPPGVHSLGRDINDHGVVVGVHYLVGDAFAWRPRTGTQILPGIEGGNEAVAVNNGGTIVGHTYTETGPQRAAIFSAR